MKKSIRTKRLLIILFSGMLVGTVGIIGVYLKNLAGTQDALFYREHNRRFCGRCGFQEWSTSTALFGLRSFNHAPVDSQKKDFAGFDQLRCQHALFTIGMQNVMLVVPDFKVRRFAMGTLTNDAFWEQPMLIAAFRTLEKENSQGDAMNVFHHLVISTKFRSKVPTNVLEALKGTNSQVLVDAMYQSYADSGQKLHNAKNK
jgi:hypothetical protein